MQCCILEHHVFTLCNSCVRVPQVALGVKRWICWKAFKYAEDAKKKKNMNVQNMDDFSEEQKKVELLGTTEGLMSSR